MVEVGGADDQQHDGDGVEQTAPPVERFAAGIRPFAAQFDAADDKGGQAEGNDQIKDETASRKR